MLKAGNFTFQSYHITGLTIGFSGYPVGKKGDDLCGSVLSRQSLRLFRLNAGQLSFFELQKDLRLCHNLINAFFHAHDATSSSSTWISLVLHGGDDGVPHDASDTGTPGGLSFRLPSAAGVSIDAQSLTTTTCNFGPHASRVPLSGDSDGGLPGSDSSSMITTRSASPSQVTLPDGVTLPISPPANPVVSRDWPIKEAGGSGNSS